MSVFASEMNTCDRQRVGHCDVALAAAITLNNVALEMMERSSHRQAYKTLLDAIKAMKMAESRTCGDFESRQLLAKYIKTASKRLRQPIISSTYIPICILSTINQLDKSSCFATSSGIPMIELENESSDALAEFQSVATAIILYNTGVTLLCRSQDASNENDASQNQNIAIHLLTLSNDLLAAEYEEVNENDDALLHQIVCTKSIVLATMSIIWRARGELERSYCCMATISCIQMTASIDPNSKTKRRSTMAAPSA